MKPVFLPNNVASNKGYNAKITLDYLTMGTIL
jgi:hypothetical protein